MKTAPSEITISSLIHFFSPPSVGEKVRNPFHAAGNYKWANKNIRKGRKEGRILEIIEQNRSSPLQPLRHLLQRSRSSKTTKKREKQ